MLIFFVIGNNQLLLWGHSAFHKLIHTAPSVSLLEERFGVGVGHMGVAIKSGVKDCVYKVRIILFNKKYYNHIKWILPSIYILHKYIIDIYIYIYLYFHKYNSTFHRLSIFISPGWSIPYFTEESRAFASGMSLLL